MDMNLETLYQRDLNFEHLTKEEGMFLFENAPLNELSHVANELRKIGAMVEEFPDSIIIHPSSLHGAEIETYNDHRIAMSFSIAGLKIPGITICNPSCVAKTYPVFFDGVANHAKAVPANPSLMESGAGVVAINPAAAALAVRIPPK